MKEMAPLGKRSPWGRAFTRNLERNFEREGQSVRVRRVSGR